MRLIDDWLLVTTDLAKASRFYDMMSEGTYNRLLYESAIAMHSPGHPEYGCFISKDKTLMNFDHPELASIVDPRSKGILFADVCSLF